MSSMLANFCLIYKEANASLLLIYGKQDGSDNIIYASSQPLCTPLIVSFFLFSNFCSGAWQLLHFLKIFLYVTINLSPTSKQNSYEEIPTFILNICKLLRGNIRRKIKHSPTYVNVVLTFYLQLHNRSLSLNFAAQC